MQSIHAITVRNFRSCAMLENLELASFVPLVGYNNAGKSNVLAALQWLLRRSALPESDFFNPAAAVSVEASIGGMNDAVLDRITAQHRDRLRPFVNDETLHIKREQATPGGGAAAARLYVRDPAAGDNDAGWVPNPTGIDNAIAALFPEPLVIGAMEDAGKDIGKYETSTTIGKLIAQLMKVVSENNGREIQTRLNALRDLLAADGVGRARELVAFDESANRIVSEFFPGVQVRVHVPAPELSTVIKAGTILVYEGHGGEADPPAGRDVSAYGHGAQRAIQMSLVRQLAESTQAEAPGRTLLLIDEPELYLHPQAIAKVCAALRTLSQGSYQVIFTTHSPLMIARQDLANVLVLLKDGRGRTWCRRRAGSAIQVLEDEARHQLDELFNTEGAAQILFSDRVVLVEGKTERELLPDLFQHVYGVTPADKRVGVVPLDGVGSARKCLRVLKAMSIPARVMTDLDYAFRGAIAAGLLDRDDPDVALCRGRCGKVANQIGGSIAEDGFFSGENRVPCFHALAEDELARHAIQRLHEKLLEHDVWVWTLGAIERHLGITGKTYTEWSRLRSALAADGEGALHDPHGIASCIRWLTGDA